LFAALPTGGVSGQIASCANVPVVTVVEPAGSDYPQGQGIKLMNSDKVTVFDLVCAVDGTIGAFVSEGQPSGALLAWGAPVLRCHAKGRSCVFLTRQKGVSKDWCEDFAERYFSAGDDIVIVNFSLCRVRVPNAHAWRA
jgi:hypothetical protein